MGEASPARGGAEVQACADRGGPGRRWKVLVGTSVLLSCALPAGMAVIGLGATRNDWLGYAVNVAMACSAGMFLAGGVMGLCHWRIQSDRRSLLLGSAMVLLGGLSLPAGALQRVGGHPGASQFATALAGVATVASLLLVLWATLPAEPTGLSLRERVPSSVTFAAGMVLFAVVAICRMASGSAPDDTTSRIVTAFVLAVCWFAVAVVAAIRSRHGAWFARITPLLAAMGIAQLLAAADGGLAGGWALGALVLDTLVAGLAFMFAANALDEAVTLDRGHLLDVSEALRDAQDAAERYAAARQELAHDARNAVAGLRAALLTLDRCTGADDGALGAPLRRAAIEEIGHLEHLLFRTEDEPFQDYDAADVVRNAVETRRALGDRINVRFRSPAPAHGRPHDLMTALQNVLVNAAAHAPDSSVEVDLVLEGGGVFLTVADRGPGLDPAEADRIFHRGVRGVSSSGSGLGLHIAVSLMREQGGDLVLLPSDAGAVFAFTIPAARPLRAFGDDVAMLAATRAGAGAPRHLQQIG